jgi:hypothetical protein
MEKDKFAKYKISRGRTKKTLTGTIIEDEYLIIEAETKKEAEEMFDKRWKEDK